VKKHSIKLLYFCFILLIMPVISKASDIEITSLESSIILNENRTADIDETYDLYFINDTKIFNRTLDRILEVKNLNNNKLVLNSKITKIKSKNDLKIIDLDKLTTISLELKGNKDTIDNINLSYNYDLGIDESRKYDEFYYNVISNFDGIVSNVAFEIILPKDAKINEIDFIYNNDYNLIDDEINYDIEDNVITGYLNKMLKENDTFGIRIELPNGYFKNTRDNFNYLNYLYLIFPFITIIIVIVYWFKYGKGNSLKKQYTYNSPNNFDPAEIGYLYKGKSEEADVLTLVLHLANKGYLKLEENDDGYKLGKENSFNFIKFKKYKEKNAAQKLLFEGIFKDREKSTLKDVEYTIMDGLMTTKKMLDNVDNKKKIFNININKTKLVSMIMIIISTILITITPVKIMTGSYWLVLVLSITMIFGLAIIAIINTDIIPKIILSLIFIGGTIYLNIYSLIGQNKLLIIYIIGVTLVLISTLIYSKLPVRTKFGNKRLGEVEGFRSELLNMNQVKLKKILDENNNYFYEMIPYAMVFNIVDDWTALGKGIINYRPSWHITKEAFDLKKEVKFMKNVIFTTTQVMIKGLYCQKESSQLEFKEDVVKVKLNR